jgi:redox-sensitive bicupin YhaK (pirin superfamily)
MPFFSEPLDAVSLGSGPFSAKRFELDRIDPGGLPIQLFDDFRVAGRPFGPHPHAGVSVLTYLFEDTPGALRNRDSLGNELTVGAGGIVWLQSGRGVLHEETPEDHRALHGAQIYVSLSAANKAAPPRTLWLAGGDVPVWSDAEGNTVRVVVGAFGGMASPLVPAEPFDLLDLRVARSVSVDLAADRIGVVHARDDAKLEIGDEEITLRAGRMISVRGGATLRVSAKDGARLLVLSGVADHAPRFTEGPFVLDHPRQLGDVVERYRRGEMGILRPRT